MVDIKKVEYSYVISEMLELLEIPNHQERKIRMEEWYNGLSKTEQKVVVDYSQEAINALIHAFHPIMYTLAEFALRLAQILQSPVFSDPAFLEYIKTLADNDA